MIQGHVDKNDATTGVVRNKITHDLVLDVYETSLEETDPESKAAIIAAAKVLSENIGEYLIEPEKE